MGRVAYSGNAPKNEVECCLICKEFLCPKHYDKKEAIYTKQSLDTWKRLSESGLTFGGRRKELESLLEKGR